MISRWVICTSHYATGLGLTEIGFYQSSPTPGPRVGSDIQSVWLPGGGGVDLGEGELWEQPQGKRRVTCRGRGGVGEESRGVVGALSILS